MKHSFEKCIEKLPDIQKKEILEIKSADVNFFLRNKNYLNNPGRERCFIKRI